MRPDVAGKVSTEVAKSGAEGAAGVAFEVTEVAEVTSVTVKILSKY
jgi:hypothetical protein